MITLKTQLTERLTTAMKTQQVNLVSAIRNIKTKLMEVEKKDGKELDDEGVIKALKTLAKQRQDAMDSYKLGGRIDLWNIENFELQVIKGYLPVESYLSEIEILTLIEELKNEFSTKVIEYKSGKKGTVGFFLGALIKKAPGKINPVEVNSLIIQELDK
jgi:uncharacterized protein YqeY